MAFEPWLAFTLACIVLTLIPGPSVLLVVGQSLVKGRRAAMLCIMGDMVGGVMLMALSFMGVGAILAASAVLFQIVKWAGVAYLAYLGYRQIEDALDETWGPGAEIEATNGWGSFWAGAVTAVLNPKAIIFYMAFLAQFIDPAGNMLAQMVILTTTSTIVVALLLAGYALIAARTRQVFQSRVARRRMGYTGGSLMIGGSVAMAVAR